MLEKMGWSKGKGLGMNEDGEQNFIRVSHKTDQKGMGYQDRDDQWTGHENQFNSLLKSLDNSANVSENESANEEPNKGTPTFGLGFASAEKKSKKSKSVKSELSGKSLEEMSRKSGVRVHYRKFTRGKDISRYSEKDLANIFGKKCMDSQKMEAGVEQGKPASGEIVSIKMKKKKKKSKKTSDESQAECAKTAEIETTTANNNCMNSLDDSANKVSKKKKRDKTISNNTTALNSEVNKNESVPISNTEFIDGILNILVNSGHSSTVLKQSNNDDEETTPANNTSQNIIMNETFEINRYHAEMFRFVDLDGFPSANLSDLSGYGYGKEFELKISEKSKDQNKINDLWDYALINKYGKEVIQTKKANRYSIKQLKKKNVFMKL